MPSRKYWKSNTALPEYWRDVVFPKHWRPQDEFMLTLHSWRDPEGQPKTFPSTATIQGFREQREARLM